MSAPTVLASVVPPPSPPQTASMARFNPVERHYLRNMKRKDRAPIVKLMDADTKKMFLRLPPLRIQVLQSALPEDVKMQIFETLRTCSSDKYIQWVKRMLELPLGIRASLPPCSSVRDAVVSARALMDSVSTGFEDVKTEILKLVCQQASGSFCASGFSLGLEGPPGTGKTHFSRHAIAKTLHRPLVEVQLGGATDISYLLGIIYSYEGSKEGRLAAGMIEAGVRNPIFYFDEVDKISDTDRGRELASVLIHLIDPTSNSCIRDRYFHGIDIDFSECLFIFSYNDASKVSHILLDRIRSFRIERPTMQERCEILTRHIIPRVSKRLGTSQVLDEDAVRYIAETSDRRDVGMRGAEKDVEEILSLAQLKCVETNGDMNTITSAYSQTVLQNKRRKCDGAPPTGMYL
jgi:ATP-dependent Lon protease